MGSLSDFSGHLLSALTYEARRGWGRAGEPVIGGPQRARMQNVCQSSSSSFSPGAADAEQNGRNKSAGR